MGAKQPGENRRGREAKSPGEIPSRGWKDILLRVKDELGEDHITIVSAGVAFYALLAVFPGLAALVSLYGLILNPAEVQNQLTSFQGIMPPEAYQILAGQLQSITSQSADNLGFGFFGGLLLTIWSANKGVTALMEALNIVYEEKESRGFFKKTFTSLSVTFLGILFVVITLAAIVITPAVLAFLPLPAATRHIFTFLQWPILAIIVVLLLNFIYRYLPHRDRAKWRWVSYGSVFAGITWMLASALFSFYVINFGNYNETYGSLGAVIVLMTWFFITAFIVLLGGELNSEIEHQTAEDTTQGEFAPMGERGAYVADHVGEAKGAKPDRKSKKKR